MNGQELKKDLGKHTCTNCGWGISQSEVTEGQEQELGKGKYSHASCEADMKSLAVMLKG